MHVQHVPVNICTRFSVNWLAQTCRNVPCWGAVKTPEERGPFSTWVVEVRNSLDLTSEQVAAATGYDNATIRKLEGGQVTRPQRRKVTEFLQRVAREKAMRIPPPPGEATPATTDTAGDTGELVAVVRELVEEVRLSRLASDRNADVLAQLLGVVLAGRLPPGETEDAADALARQDTGQ